MVWGFGIKVGWEYGKLGFELSSHEEFTRG